MIIYNKSVPDKIPDIIRAEGKVCHTKVLDREQWLEQLNRKHTELADIVEVVHGIVTARGVTVKEFENLRLQKREARGGFEERVFLVNVE